MTDPEFHVELNAMVDAIAEALKLTGTAAAAAIEQGKLVMRFAEADGERVILAVYDGRMVEVGPAAVKAALEKRRAGGGVA